MSCSIIEFNSTKYVVTVIHDITTQKLQEAALKETNEMLANEKTLLHNKNIALKEVLEGIEDQKEDIKHQIQNNINNIIVPLVIPLKQTVDPKFMHMYELLESSLKEITTPLANDLEILYAKLTPREIEICNLIKSNYDSKEISLELHLSIHTVHTQRRRIRKKLGINDNKTNLTSYLMSH